MVRTGRFVTLLLIAVLTVPLSASAAPDERTDTPQPVVAQDHPLFAQLPPVPDAVRLWAQMSGRGDAFLTLQHPVLPLPYTPPMSTGTQPALSFEAFRHLTTNAASEDIQYGSRPATAAWNATLHPDRPIIAEWVLSTGLRGVDAGTTVPPLLLTTKVIAIEENGFERTIAKRTQRTEPAKEAPTPVRMEVPHNGLDIPEGSRLVVTLDWSWMRAPGIGALRQPFVTVHPGSFVDIPLLDPVRVLSLQERMIAGDLYVESKVAHLFAVENLALGSANLVVAGPSVQMQGGRPLVKAPRDGPSEGHVATFEWQLPVSLTHLRAGTYDLYVTAGQVNEPGPRVIAKQPVKLGSDLTDAAATTPPLGAIAAAALASLGLSALFVHNRRRL